MPATELLILQELKRLTKAVNRVATALEKSHPTVVELTSEDIYEATQSQLKKNEELLDG